jgi:hypothetical protein
MEPAKESGQRVSEGGPAAVIQIRIADFGAWDEVAAGEWPGISACWQAPEDRRRDRQWQQGLQCRQQLHLTH